MGYARSRLGLLAALLLVLPALALATHAGRAQEDAGISIVAAGLTNPRGITWNATGSTMYVAQAGTGGDAPASVDVPPPVGPLTGGPSASVVWIADGCPALLAKGLPSSRTATGEISGVSDVAILGETIYALVAGGGPSHGNPDQPAGVYTIAGDLSATPLVDLSDWMSENPVANVPQGDFDPGGSFFAMIAAPGGEALWIVESNSQQLLSVTPDGEVTRIADLSGDNQVPTAITPAQDGGAYVGFLSGVPYPDGAARVVKVNPDGSLADVWTGLTTVTGLATTEDGTLYASLMSTGNTAEPPFVRPNSGKIVRQSGPDSAQDVATGLNLPVSLRLGPDGALYAASPAIGADDGSGVIYRVDPSTGAPLAVSAAAPAPDCGGDGGATPVAETVRVELFDFGFSPDSIEIAAGTTVTWVNVGDVEHTTVSFADGKKVWDSDIMASGDEYSFTFEEPGSYDYLCGLHPNMTARIVVT